MCLQNIQEGVWSWSSRARLGNRDLRPSNQGPGELLQGTCADCDGNKVRVTRMNKTNSGKSGHMEKKGQREVKKPHQSISMRKWCSRNQRWECQLMQRCQVMQQPKKTH